MAAPLSVVQTARLLTGPCTTGACCTTNPVSAPRMLGRGHSAPRPRPTILPQDRLRYTPCPDSAATLSPFSLTNPGEFPMFLDTRLGNTPRWWVATPKDW